MSKKLRLILGDQLNIQHSWFTKPDPEVTYILMECLSETNYVRHHVQKVCAFFLAMRHFAGLLEDGGHQVKYIPLDSPDNQHSIAKNLEQEIKAGDYDCLEYQLPDEYRLDKALIQLKEKLDLPVRAYDTEHFLSTREAVGERFAGKKQFLLETFYRHIRKQYDILMEADGKTPRSGRWNYDAENRKKLPAKVEIPPAPTFSRSVAEIVDLLDKMEVKTIGRIDPEAFDWPITREEQLEILEDFLKNRLENFGRYQDAMTIRDPFLFHSRLSFGLNTKLISPLEVVRAAVDHWQENQDKIDLAQIEGFVRQIIGWREYMRGIYWAKMPEYAELNFFDHQNTLPDWYWSGQTQMKCLAHSINQSLDRAYAHHIQRLMVTGNFALLLGVDPDEVDQWYLGIYIDAIEWVEITNTRGMSQFADGGIVGTKPYISSANYIHKMGDYCKNCTYDRKKKTGENACPFNSLYWDFYERHRDKLGNNPRVGMMYRVWDKMSEKDKTAILQQADHYKNRANEL